MNHNVSAKNKIHFATNIIKNLQFAAFILKLKQVLEEYHLLRQNGNFCILHMTIFLGPREEETIQIFDNNFGKQSLLLIIIE